MKVVYVFCMCIFLISATDTIIAFFSSFICIVCFLLKSTEFHDMRSGCQIILIHLLLLVYHKLLSIDC